MLSFDPRLVRCEGTSSQNEKLAETLENQTSQAALWGFR